MVYTWHKICGTKSRTCLKGLEIGGCRLVDQSQRSLSVWTNQRPGSPASGEAEGGCGELRGQSLVSGPASVVVRPGEDEEVGEGQGEVEAARNLLASGESSGQEKVNKSTVKYLNLSFKKV